MIPKKIIGILLCGLFITTTTPANAEVPVRGYYKTDGTYVQPHIRSEPDGNFNNNWSTKGNNNPYTGKEGTKTHPENSTGSGYNMEVPAPTADIDIEQLVEQQQKANEELSQKIKEQTERIEKQLEESKKRNETQREESKKRNETQREETDKRINELMNDLDEVGKNYTPPNYITYSDTQTTISSDQTNTAQESIQNESVDSDSKVESSVHKKAVHSKQSLWDKFTDLINDIFS